MSSSKILTIGVHDGLMHADEVMAVATMAQLYDVEVTRTRDVNKLRECDMRIDVGDDYNHETKTYDHHMQWFSVRHPKPRRKRQADGSFKEYERGPLRSGFGLIWYHYGLEVVKVVVDNIFSEQAKRMFRDIDYIRIQQEIDEEIVSFVDAVDNGESEEFDLRTKTFRVHDIPQLISSYNPSPMDCEMYEGKELERLQDRAFSSAVDFASGILVNSIKSKGENLYYQCKFSDLIGNMKERGLLIMDKYIPWTYAYGKSGDLTHLVNMVVFPVTTGWMCQTPFYRAYKDDSLFPKILSDGSPRKYKYQAPESICGLRDEELQEATGVADAVFCHKGGHLAVAKSKEGCIKLAEYIVKNARS